MIKLFLSLVLPLFLVNTAHAESAKIAVASNFSGAMKLLAAEFKKQTGTKVILAFGSTGKQYAQIRNGAPYDAYFAADSRRPKLLEKAGFGVKDSRFTYAIGRLALWSAKKNYVDANVLKLNRFKHIALANPKLAPYGFAAKEYMQKINIYNRSVTRMVFGENISQTYQFIATGNADLGFIAWSQLKQPGKENSGSWQLIPQDQHSPIEQQAMILTSNKQAKAFVNFVKSPAGQTIIKQFGYSLPTR